MAAVVIAIPIPLQQSYNEVNNSTLLSKTETDFSGFLTCCNSLHHEVILTYNTCAHDNTCKVSFNLHAKACRKLQEKASSLFFHFWITASNQKLDGGKAWE